MKKRIKIVAIIFLLTLLFEVLMVAYNAVVYKLYDSRHLINNETYTINLEDLAISTEETNGIIKINKNIEGSIYNISLNLKESNKDDTYLTVTCNEKVCELRRENIDLNKFKAYVNEKDINTVEIKFNTAQLDKDNIQNITINENLSYMPQKGINVLRIAIIFTLAVAVYIIFCISQRIKNKEYKLDKAKLFVVIALILGIGIGTLVIPLTTYDEHTHFWRTYEISEGHITSSWKNLLPKSIIDLVISDDVYHINDRKYSDLKDNLTKKLDAHEQEAFFVGGAAAYSPFNYIPQLIGVTIGRVMHLNPMLIAYLGRMTNFLSFVLIVYIAIKLMPKEKWKNIIMIIALMPMTLNLATSMSPDSLAISLSMLLISYIMHIKYSDKNITYIQICLLAVLCIATSLVKIAYLPLIILFLLIPSKKFKDKKIYYSIFVLILLFTIIINLVWMRTSNNGVTAATRTNSTEQIYFVLSNPLDFIINIGNTILENIYSYATTMVGGWNTTNLGQVLLIILLVFITFVNNDSNNIKDKDIVLNWKDRIIIGISILLSILLVFAGLYIQWTIAKLDRVEGIQGRYFLPILTAILILCETGKLKINIKNYWIKYIIFLLIIYIPVYINIIKAYL